MHSKSFWLVILLKPGTAVIAYRKFNDSLPFIIKKNPVINSTSTVVEFLKHNPNALIVERASAPHVMDSVQDLVMTTVQKIFLAGSIVLYMN